MAVNNEPLLIGVLFDLGSTIAAADTTTVKDIMAAPDADTRVDVINVTTDDTAVSLLKLWMHDGTTATLLGNVPMATTAGNTALGATPALNVLSHANMAGIVKVDAGGNKFILVPSGSKLQMSAVAALTSGKTAWIYCQGGKFADA